MNDAVGSYDAKTHLPKLLERVAKGERITITKHGVPVAMLVPPPASETPDIKQTIKKLKQVSKGRSLGDLSIRELIDAGRRF